MKEGNSEMDDTRIEGYDPLIPPQILQQDNELTENGKKTVLQGREDAKRILMGQDDRVLVVVGPCSIHDVDAALEYGEKLKAITEKFQGELSLVMRVYFEKPRTTVGWKGLINDPMIDGSFQINKGLKIARKLLCDLTDMGIPVGSELLDTISPQFIGDLVSWGAIGARTTESQLHRELASGCSFPVGFKNGTDGNVDIAIDAIVSASHPHRFLGVTKHGLAAITKTKGNQLCHTILRGAKSGPNYDEVHVKQVKQQLKKGGLDPKIMIDCSHGNSQKNHLNQPKVLENIAKQIEEGDESIFGLMIESNIKEGTQKVPESGAKDLKYGVSITDACVSWDQTVPMLERLAEAVRKRRSKLHPIHEGKRQKVEHAN